MPVCAKCGTNNIEGATFCASCGSQIGGAPPPESWRAPTGDLNQVQTEAHRPDEGMRPAAAPSAHPTYTPGQGVYRTNAPGGGPAPGADKKIVAGICGILLGGFGVHKFVLGYSTEGLIMLLVTVLTCGFGGVVMGIVGLVEGIIYLTKSDDEFVRTYVQNKKGWF